MQTVSEDVKRMLGSNVLKEFAGEAWLIEQEGEQGVVNLVGLAVFRGRRKEVSCGHESLDQIFDEEMSSHEKLAEVQEEIESWRTAAMGNEFEALLDILRKEGTEGVAARLGCTQRRVQQKLKEMVELETCQADLFFMGGEA